MNVDKQTEHVVRESILKLLSDVELATVSTEETNKRLLDGDEYLDLEKLSDGVLRAPGQVRPMGRVLVRRAVQDDTWNKILAILSTTLIKTR
jgi:hypothetical protein